MIRSRFFWKLYAGYIAIILLTTAFVVGLSAWRLRQNWLHETEVALQSQATILREIARPTLVPRDSGAADPALLQESVRALGAEIAARFTVVRADGVVIADSQQEPAQMNSQLDRPEILAAHSHGVGVSTRRSESVDAMMLHVALRVEDDARIAGYARAALPLVSFDSQLRELTRPVIFGAALAAFLALLLGLYASWRVTSPLASITGAARAIAQGKFDERVAISARDEVGDLARSFSTMRDELERRVETITTDRSRVLAIISSMVEGVVAVDSDERIVHMNVVAGSLLGVRPEDAVGKRVWEATRFHEVNEALAQSMREGTSVRGEARLVGEKRDRVIEVNAAPLRGGDGATAGAVVVLHDVTELRRLEEVRREFVANVSHELKTPLTAIRGIVETLIDDVAIEPAKREHFHRRIHDQTLRLSALVTDLLTLSRVESRESALDRAICDLREIAAESARAAAPAMEDKGLAFTVALHDAAVLVVGDRAALAQAINNLLDNAVKYTPAGGRVGFSLSVVVGMAHIKVQDSGIGIELREQERIFERFYRVDKGRSRDLGGTGLGLSIVRNVASAHGGRVSVESAPGQGSLFSILVPLPPAPV
ncbi:MAG: ATP-binding protein [bacterium]